MAPTVVSRFPPRANIGQHDKTPQINLSVVNGMSLSWMADVSMWEINIWGDWAAVDGTLNSPEGRKKKKKKKVGIGYAYYGCRYGLEGGRSE